MAVKDLHCSEGICISTLMGKVMKYTIVSRPRTKRSNRLLPLGILVALVLASFKVNAFIPGELRVLSTDKESLRAELVLTQVTIPSRDSLRVSVASTTAYSQAGLPRDEYLSQLEFNVSGIAEDHLVVQIIAPQPLSNPSIDALLQFETADQVVIRYYSLVQDGLGIDEAITTSTVANSESLQQLQILAHRVVEGDTLWNIAKRLRPKGISIAQIMDQLYAANPDAFLDADSTQVKKGSLLILIPDGVSESAKVDLSLDKALLIPHLESTESAVKPVPQEQGLEQAQLVDKGDEVTQLIQAEVQETEKSEQKEEVEYALSVPNQTQRINTTDAVGLSGPDIQQLDQNGLLISEAIEDQTNLAIQEPPHMAAEEPVFAPETQLTETLSLPVEQGKVINWQFFGISEDNQQKMISVAIFTLAIIFVAIFSLRRLFKRPADPQTALPNERDSEDNLAESVLNGPFSGDIDADQSIFADNYQHSPDVSELSKPKVEAEDLQIGGAEIAFPGLRELESQMGKEFSAEQSLKGVQEDNTLDMEAMDPLQVRLDMATICMEINDIEAAREILQEIILESDEPGKSKAQAMLDNLEN